MPLAPPALPLPPGSSCAARACKHMRQSKRHTGLGWPLRSRATTAAASPTQSTAAAAAQITAHLRAWIPVELPVVGVLIGREVVRLIATLLSSHRSSQYGSHTTPPVKSTAATLPPVNSTGSQTTPSQSILWEDFFSVSFSSCAHTNHCHPPIQMTATLPYKSLPFMHGIE